MTIPGVIVENCIIVYCINCEGDEALVFDKVIVDDILADNSMIEPMQVLSVLFDFDGMVRCDVGDDRYVFALRKLYAMAFLLRQLVKVSQEWFVDETVKLFEICERILMINPELTRPVVCGFAFMLRSMAFSFRDRVFCSNEKFCAILEMALRMVEHVELPSVFGDCFQHFFLNALSIYCNVSSTLFVTLVNAITRTLNAGCCVPYNYVALGNRLLSYLEGDEEIDTKIMVFCLLSLLCRKHECVTQFVFDEENLKVLASFFTTVSNTICGDDIPKGAILMSTREPVVPLDTFLDEQTFVVEVPFCRKYDVIPTSIVEAPHYVQADIILHAISQFCSLEKHALLLDAMFSRPLVTVGQSLFIICWVNEMLRVDIDEAVVVLQETPLLRKILDLECVTSLVNNVILYLIKHANETKFLATVLKKFEDDVLALCLSDKYFECICGCCISRPAKMCTAMSEINFAHVISNLMLVLRSRHIATPNCATLRHTRMMLFKLVNIMIVNDLIAGYALRSAVFLETLCQMVFEMNVELFVVKSLCHALCVLKFDEKSMHIVLRFLHKLYSTLDSLRCVNLCRLILHEIVAHFGMNPSELVKAFLQTSLMSDLVDFVLFTKKSEDILCVLDVFQCFGKLKGSVRNHWIDIHPFVRLAGLIEQQLKQNNDDTLAKLWSIVCGREARFLDRIECIVNSSPLSLTFRAVNGNSKQSVAMLTEICRVCERDLDSAFEVALSDFPSALIEMIMNYRERLVADEVLNVAIKTLGVLSLHSMTSKDLLTVFQTLTPISGDFRPVFTSQVLDFLATIFDSDNFVPNSFVRLVAENQSIKLPDLELPEPFESFYFWVVIQFHTISKEKDYELFHLTTADDTYLRFLISHGRIVVIYEHGSSCEQYTIDATIRPQKWRNLSFQYADHCLTFYSNGTQVSKIQIPKLVFSHSLRKWYLARDVDCSISSFGFLNEHLDHSLIQLHGEFPFSYVTSFDKAEVVEFSEKYSKLFVSEITKSAVVMFNAAISHSRELVNLSKRFDCPCEHNGEIYHFSPPPKALLHSIGGLPTLFPLFAQLDKPLAPKQGQAVAYDIDPDLLPKLINVLTKVLITSYPNQEELASINGFQILACLISRARLGHITARAIHQLMTLYSLFECKELRRQLLVNVFFNVMLWIYLPIEIQMVPYQCLCQIFDQQGLSGKVEIAKWITLTEIMATMKVCLWTVSQKFSLGCSPKVDTLTKGVECERPCDLAPIRQKIWEFADRVAHVHMTDNDCTQLCALACDKTDPNLTVEFVYFLVKLIDERHKVLMKHLGKELHFKHFLPLFSCDHERLRIASLHLFFSLRKNELKAAYYPCTVKQWLNAIICTMNAENVTSECADCLFGYLYGLYENADLRIHISKETQRTAYNPNLVILPLAMSVVVKLDPLDAVPYVQSLLWCSYKHAAEIVKVPQWDHPFLQYLVDRLSAVHIPGDDCRLVLKTLARLYTFAAEDSSNTSLARVPITLARFAVHCGEDLSHIASLTWSTVCERLLKPKTQAKVSINATFELVTKVFEYLFLIPVSDQYFSPPFASAACEKQTVTYQSIQQLKSFEKPPHVRFVYATRTTTAGVWEDSLLAETLLRVCEGTPNLFTLTQPRINPLFMFSFIIGIGLQHEESFYRFLHYVKFTTQFITPKLTAQQVTAFTNYMQGLIKTYMRTNRQHQSHLYLLEHTTAYRKLIYTVFKSDVQWGTSIDSFDGCFTEGHNFAYAIIERFSNVSEDLLVARARAVTVTANDALPPLNSKLKLACSMVSEMNEQRRVQLENTSVHVKQIQSEGFKAYRGFWKTLSSEMGPWCAPESMGKRHWRLHKTFQKGFRRGLMKENLEYTRHEDAAMKRDQGADSKEIWKSLMLTDFIGDGSVVTLDPDETLGRENVYDQCDVVLKLDTKLVGMKSVQSGAFILTEKFILFDSPAKYIEIELNSVTMIFMRHYLLLNNSVEIFTSEYRSYFFDFVEGQRTDVLSNLAKLQRSGKMANLRFLQMTESDIKPMVSDATKKWQMGQLSNFEYLMLLNIYSGRTYNDLSKYPVMPWVIADYTSQTLDLKRESTFRDLSKPIGTYSAERLNLLKQNAFESPGADKNLYFFGSFYSSAAVVIGYLVRMEPFASLHIELQSGKFDFPERLFSSIPKAWKSVTTENMDFRELIPEFFYLPDFLINENRFDFGKGVNDVELPPWAHSPHEFVCWNREALESPCVTMMLPAWIDAIFGVRSRGPQAAEIDNIFNPLFFEDMSMEYSLELRQEFASCFGQAPVQLFSELHPTRVIPIRRMGLGERDMSVIYEPDEPNILPILWIDSFDGRMILVNKEFKYMELGKRKNGSKLIHGDLHMAKGLVKTNRYVAICASAYDAAFSVFDLATNETCAIKRFHTKRITSIALDGSYVVTGSADCTAVIWKLVPECGHMMPKVISTITRHRTSVMCVDINTEANLVVSCSRDGCIVTATAAAGRYLKSQSVLDEGEPVHAKISNSGTICVCFAKEDRSCVHLYDSNLHYFGKYVFECQIQCWCCFEWYNGSEYLIVALKHGKLVCVQLPSIQPIWQIVGIDFDAQALTIDESMSSVLLGNSYGKVISIPLE